MPVQLEDVSLVDAIYRIHIREDMVLDREYPGLFPRGKLRRGVYFKFFPLKDWYKEQLLTRLKRKLGRKINSKIVDIALREYRS